jgi:YHS domain-containing protein
MDVRVLVLALVLGAATALAAKPAGQAVASTDPMPPGYRCPVDGQIVHDRQRPIEWEGRRYFADSDACVRRFEQDPERFARRVEPRAALFAAGAPSRSSPWLLVVSVYLVVGLLSGGVAAYLAVGRGVAGFRWFLVGLAGNVVGLALAWSALGSRPVTAPPGLAKAAATADPESCPSCGRTNHPSAERCAGCGAALSPATRSEVRSVLS